MPTARDVVREYFPHATDDECDYVLWEHTGFPGFFNGDPETALRSQVCALATLGPLPGEDRFGTTGITTDALNVPTQEDAA